MELPTNPRLNRARIALEGLSVGDSLGGFFEGSKHNRLSVYVRDRTPPDVQTWHYTDDTNMALSIYENLRLYGEIRQDELAKSFAEHYEQTRGYGAGARRILMSIKAGNDWRTVATDIFGGTGSYGNGGAMRIAPLGVYFADDLPALIANARKSSEITHAHPEGIAGTIAVAVAAAVAHQATTAGERPDKSTFIERVLAHIPASEVKSHTQRARDITSTEVAHVAGMIGNGSRISAQDTVPFVLWCAGTYLDDYEEAIWQTASGGGDVDTTCAMVGGIVATYTGIEAIPADWRQRREPLPNWALGTNEA